MKPKTVRAAALLAALLVVAAGCWNPTGEALKAGTEAGSGEHGLVVLQFHDLRALTITPEISLEIDSYELSFTRTGFQPVTVGGVPGDATQSDPVSLLPGPWQVTVSAFNDDSPAKVIGFGEREVSVSPRQTTTTGISIRSLTGEGTLSLTAHWGELDLLSPSISGTLSSGATGEESEVSMSIDGSSASLEENLEAGTYLLSLELFESETPIAGFVNAVLIVYEETTTAELEFRPVSGTVVAELADEITRPIVITLEGLQETLSPEESMTVRAETAGAVDSYQWYLDGYAIPGEDEQEITLGPGLDEGEYVLTVVVQRGEIQSAEAGEFTVGSSLETYTVTYNPNGGEGDVPDPQTKTHGVDLTIEADSGNLERTGYTFAGWNTQQDGNGQNYNHGDTYSNDTDLTLYARWTANTYTVTFNPTDGTGGSKSVTVTFGSPMPEARAPTSGREGYEFGGYYTHWHSILLVQYYTAEMQSARDWDIAANTGLMAKWVLVPSQTVAAVSAGYYHTMILDTNDTLWATGSNQWGQLGDGTTEYRSTPVEIMSGVASVSAGWDHTMIVDTGGTLWATGNNEYGQLGDGTTENKSTPVEVMSGVAAVSAGGGHTMILDTGGTLWATGWNERGELGDGTTEDKHTPVAVMSGVAAVSAGDYHTMILKTDGTLWATGWNINGRLGDGTTEDKSSPVEVMEGVAAVSAGSGHTMILDTGGTLWATGLNHVGQLGDGTTEPKGTPAEVISGVAAVSAGTAHTMVIKIDDTLRGTGGNWSGQLGDGTTEDKSIPVEVMSGVAAVSAGNSHTMILDTDGTLWATGSNHRGQLGTGEIPIGANATSPLEVMSGVESVSAGSYHTMILDTDGTLWATGWNEYGQLGDGTTESRSLPVRVCMW